MKIIRCSDEGYNALINLVNAGVRAAGLQCVRDAAVVLAVLESAEHVPDPSIPNVVPELPEEA